MRRVRYEDEPSSSHGMMYLAAGAAAGLAAGLFISRRYGGLREFAAAVRGALLDGLDEFGYGEDELEGDEELAGTDGDAAAARVELEERVLEAFRNDPVLSERAVDIGAIGDGIIELTGWVHAPAEVAHASTLARGVPDVDTVVNGLVVRDDLDAIADEADRRASGRRDEGGRDGGAGFGARAD
jgi:hypothetical protein